MLVCAKCGEKLAEEAVFCPCCGARIAQSVICLFCGRELRQDSRYCDLCGKSISAARQVQTAVRTLLRGYWQEYAEATDDDGLEWNGA